MNHNRMKSFIEYLRTIILSFLVAALTLIIVLVVIQQSVYHNQKALETQDETVEYYLVGVLIEKNKYLETQSPKNYKINLKLGMLYEIYKDYKNSEIEYKKAIIKAPFDDFAPQYKLANLYIRQNKLDEAQQIMDEIDERPLKSLINYKAEIYNQIGDKLYNSGNYEEAITKYQKALSYYQIIKFSQKIKDIRNSLASAYVYSAEKDVEDMKIDEAINSLNIANSMVKAPIIKYKLALLLMSSNPNLAYQYFADVFKHEPSIINFDVYYNFLSNLADVENAKGNFAQANLYKYKAQKFKEYFLNNILSVDDITLSSAEGEMLLSKWLKKYTIHLELNLKNASKQPLNSLFVHIDFKEGDTIFADYSTQVVDKKHPLAPGKLCPLVFIRIHKQQKLNEKPLKYISADVYVSKLENSYKIYLTTVNVKLVSKRKKHHWKATIKEFFRKSSLSHPKLRLFE